MNIKRSIMRRVRLAFLAVVAFALAIAGRIVYLQQVEGEKWQRKAHTTRLKNLVIPATRGNIYADDGSLLATSLPTYRLGLDLTVGRKSFQRDTLFRKKADTLGLLLSQLYRDHTPEFYKALLLDAHRNPKKSYLTINRQTVSFQDKQRIQKWPLFRLGSNKGGQVFEVVKQRVNPFDNMGKRTIGSTHDNDSLGQLGISGLEASFNVALAGKPGKGVFERLSAGSWRPRSDGSETRPTPGLDVYTTLNVNIQDVAEAALLRALRTYRADNGCVVVMDVQTGEIKAMSNLGHRGDSTYVDEKNFAVRWAVNPGSTFKLPSMVALLEEAHLSPSDPVATGNGPLLYHGRRLEDSHPHGTISLQRVFETSSNIGVAKLTLRHFAGHPERYFGYLRKFHLLDPLGLQFRGEARPVFHEPGEKSLYSKTTLPWTSIGYESLVTPLQILTFYNAIANNGRWVQPLLVRRTQRADEVQEDFIGKQRRPETPICSERTLKIVHKMLEGVVERGTATNIRNAHYKIAGKTGTSQKLIGGQYRKGIYYTSFVGYFPANAPRYSCIVVIDTPQGVNSERLYARDVSAPVFKEIADKIYATDVRLHRQLRSGKSSQADVAQALKSTPAPAAERIAAELGLPESEGWSERAALRGPLPDLRGMSLRDALFLIENKGFRASYSGMGKVTKQEFSGRTVTLILK